uniref:AlNc14C226G9224 protein n=1 Tax=Albugo laibachii Nc14 TaxID=890382 RepID=F0WS86_9STRA|nr:AlNc14C226G9224 [Albugo laibachii Nc14]|eukprot:CCA24204.1 AlNc14C226G9224 [Albugo laibachii Nc14]
MALYVLYMCLCKQWKLLHLFVLHFSSKLLNWKELHTYAGCLLCLSLPRAHFNPISTVPTSYCAVVSESIYKDASMITSPTLTRVPCAAYSDSIIGSGNSELPSSVLLSLCYLK